MAERKIVFGTPEIKDEAAEALRHATQRAEQAEAELAKLKHNKSAQTSDGELKDPPSPSSAAGKPGSSGGVEELRKDSMMAHLLDSLEAGKDIGHYGRLVFAMVARHFLPHEEVLAWIQKDRDVNHEKALLMLRQVEGRDYSPPRRDKIIEYKAKQEFPILPSPDDPDCGNLYRNLNFPQEIYEHIGHYQEAKMESEV